MTKNYEIIAGKGDHFQLVILSDGSYGVGVAYDTGFAGTIFLTREDAEKDFNRKMNSLESYISRFGA